LKGIYLKKSYCCFAIVDLVFLCVKIETSLQHCFNHWKNFTAVVTRLTATGTGTATEYDQKGQILNQVSSSKYLHFVLLYFLPLFLLMIFLVCFFFVPSLSLSLWLMIFVFLFLCGFFLSSPSALGFVELASMIVTISCYYWSLDKISID
jgi:hypothetical protein